MSTLGEHYLQTVKTIFRGQKSLADKAITQILPEYLHFMPDAESNSIAVIMKHLAGNMLSRWTDFMTTDGEKITRNRDEEFIDTLKTCEEISVYWEKGWDCLFSALDSMNSYNLLATILIRNEPHTLIEAIERQMAHYGNHVGQIVYLAKHIKSNEWTTLSIPRGKSDEYLTVKFTTQEQ